MAVYTEVGDEDLDAFIAQYDIGEALSATGIAEGVENSNYLLNTKEGRISRVFPYQYLPMAQISGFYLQTENTPLALGIVESDHVEIFGTLNTRRHGTPSSLISVNSTTSRSWILTRRTRSSLCFSLRLPKARPMPCARRRSKPKDERRWPRPRFAKLGRRFQGPWLGVLVLGVTSTRSRWDHGSALNHL